MSENFINNTSKNTFELKVDANTAFANYRINGTTLFIDYVESPKELQGTGAAGRLMQHIVNFAKEEKLEITPICGYAQQWLLRHKN